MEQTELYWLYTSANSTGPNVSKYMVVQAYFYLNYIQSHYESRLTRQLLF